MPDPSTKAWDRKRFPPPNSHTARFGCLSLDLILSIFAKGFTRRFVAVTQRCTALSPRGRSNAAPSLQTTAQRRTASPHSAPRPPGPAHPADPPRATPRPGPPCPSASSTSPPSFCPRRRAGAGRGGGGAAGRRPSSARSAPRGPSSAEPT